MYTLIKRCAMPKCPNCGQTTARTGDWACKWCAYPLLSESYKKIPKTYKQLKEETLSKQIAPVRVELEPVTEPEPVAHLEPEPEPVPAAIELTVEELLSTYEAEGVAADAIFANKFLKVTGITDRIEVKDTLDIYYINLTCAETNPLQHVRCVFDKICGPELNELTRGQTVTVQGKYDGSIINISMRNCVIVH